MSFRSLLFLAAVVAFASLVASDPLVPKTFPVATPANSLLCYNNKSKFLRREVRHSQCQPGWTEFDIKPICALPANSFSGLCYNSRNGWVNVTGTEPCNHGNIPIPLSSLCDVLPPSTSLTCADSADYGNLGGTSEYSIEEYKALPQVVIDFRNHHHTPILISGLTLRLQADEPYLATITIRLRFKDQTSHELTQQVQLTETAQDVTFDVSWVIDHVWRGQPWWENYYNLHIIADYAAVVISSESGSADHFDVQCQAYNVIPDSYSYVVTDYPVESSFLDDNNCPFFSFNACYINDT